MYTLGCIFNGIFWGVFSAILGFSITKDWQAYAIITAGIAVYVIAYNIGKSEKNKLTNTR